MGSQWVDNSPSWGDIGTSVFSGLAGAPLKAAQQTHLIETIKAQRAKAEQDRAQWDAATTAANAVDTATPQAVAPISTKSVLGPYVGDPASDPSLANELPTFDVKYTDPRAQALADAQRKLSVAGQRAAILADPKQWAQQNAYGVVANAGVPESAMERAKLDFLAGKGMPTHIGPDESKNPVKQWVPINEKNETIGQAVASRTDPSKPGQRYALSSPISAAAQNPIETVPIAQNNFHELAAKLQAKIQAGLPINDDEINAARQLKAAGWKDTIEYKEDKATGKIKPIIAPAMPPVGGHAGWLFNQLDSMDNPQPPPPMVPSVGPTISQQGITADAIASPAQLDAPLPASASAAPAPVAAAGTPRIRELPLVGTGNIPEVVKRYTDLRQVDNMAQAQQGYNSMVSNMEFDTPAADLAIVIGAAKALDPPSVVRYEESRKVEDLQGPILKIEGVVNFLKGGGKLGPQVRAQLWNMVNEKAKRDVAEVAALREQHAVQIRERGGDPDQYLPRIPEIKPVDVQKINKLRVDETGTGTGIVANTAATPQTTGPRGSGPRGARAGAVTPPPAVLPPAQDAEINAIIGR